MSTWASAAPAIGAGSLDGFAAAALMSVVCAMAITAPRRARRPSAARWRRGDRAERMAVRARHGGRGGQDRGRRGRSGG